MLFGLYYVYISSSRGSKFGPVWGFFSPTYSRNDNWRPVLNFVCFWKSLVFCYQKRKIYHLAKCHDIGIRYTAVLFHYNFCCPASIIFVVLHSTFMKIWEDGVHFAFWWGDQPACNDPCCELLESLIINICSVSLQFLLSIHKHFLNFF